MADEASGEDRDDTDDQRHQSSAPTDRRSEPDDSPFDGGDWNPSHRPLSDEEPRRERETDRDSEAAGWNHGWIDERDEHEEHDGRAARDRIPIDLSRDESEGENEEENEDADEDEYAPEPNDAPIEAGDPSLENVLFVLLGALVMLALIARVVSIPL
ncbi:DUF7312 domain-containing protein [Halopiger goleimassiliensis]|uniref:DUF7312 domain-containing protein n=1 Tax=Halopiger goleimassiliensis TaxID=1293048 RepID=UPI000677E500|nr:hypothetical protein [Halopiger goleimassiliensis]